MVGTFKVKIKFNSSKLSRDDLKEYISDAVFAWKHGGDPESPINEIEIISITNAHPVTERKYNA